MMNVLKKVLIALLTCSMLVGGTVFAEEENQGFFKPGDEYKINDEVEEITYAVQDGIVSYSDVEDLSVVGILGALEIMGEYEGNAFKPNVYTSRAMFAEAAMKLIGITNTVSSSKLSFYDVDQSNPYYNIIYTGVEMGILKGYDDNTFRPDAVISYNEALRILTCVLGYTGEVFDSNQYIKFAADAKITKGVSINNPEALTRAEMAKLLYNTLNAHYVTMSFKQNTLSYIESEDTVLEYYFDIKKDTGRVTANINGAINETSKGKTFAIDDVSYNIRGNAYNNLIGYLVDYYYDKNDNIIMMHSSNNVSEIVIDADDILGYDPESHTLKYETTGGKTKNAKVASKFTLLYNGIVPTESYDKSIFEITDGDITLVSNDGTTTYDTVFINEYRNYIIKNTTCTNEVITFLTNDDGSFKFETNNNYIEAFDENKSPISVYKVKDNGEQQISVSDFPQDCVASVFTPYLGYDNQNGNIIPKNDLKYMRIIFSAKTVEGKVRAKDSQEREIKIDDTVYPVANSNYFDADLNNITLETFEFYVDYRGQLVDIKESSGSWKYGYLIKPYYNVDDDDAKITRLKLLTTKNKVETFETNEKFSINGKKNTKNIKLIDMLGESAALIRSNFTFSQLVKYIQEEDNTISQLQTVTQSIGISNKYSDEQLQRVEAPKDYVVVSDSRSRLCDADNDEIGCYFKPQTVFKVSTVENDSDNKYAAASLDTNGKRVTLEIYDADELSPKAVVCYVDNTVDELIKTGKNKDSVWPVMFDKAYEAVDDDDMAVTRIRVIEGSGMAEYDSDEIGIADEFKRGDLLYLKGIAGKITEMQPLKYKGKIIGTDNIPSITTFEKLNNYISGYQSETIDIYMMEAYSLSYGTQDFVLQAGALRDGSKREKQITGSIMNDEWFKGGMMVYDEEEDKVFSGDRTSLKNAKDYGNNSASKVLCLMHNGAARAYYVYNME